MIVSGRERHDLVRVCGVCGPAPGINNTPAVLGEQKIKNKFKTELRAKLILLTFCATAFAPFIYLFIFYHAQIIS